MCCLLSLTWIATSSIIWRRIRCAPPDKLVITASPDTSSLSSAQMYWNRRWFLTEERKSKRFTASPSPLKPAISLVQRKTIWQCGGTESSWIPLDCNPSVAFLSKKKILIVIDFFHFVFFHFLVCTTTLSWLHNRDVSPLGFALQYLQLLPAAFVGLDPFLSVRSPILRDKWHSERKIFFCLWWEKSIENFYVFVRFNERAMK